jgi:hypothetical protein
MDERMWSGLTKALVGAHVAMLAEGFIGSPMLMPLVAGRLVGKVSVRPMIRGMDAYVAISELGNLAAGANAEEVVLSWESQDFASACEHEADFPGPCVTILWATQQRRAAYRFPYAEVTTKRGRKQLPAITPQWLPHPPADPMPAPPPAIAAALELSWQPLEIEAPYDTLDTSVAYLRSQGYSVSTAA